MFLGKEKKSTTEIVNEIQAEVYKYLKPLGFRKHGRAFCRFVDTDIAQVIEFQVGLALKGNNHCLWVNIGIRIPECEERTFDKEIPNSRLILLEEAMIYGRMGEAEKAHNLFCEYCEKVKKETKAEREYVLEFGKQVKNSGWYKMPDGGLRILPNENRGHIAYLQELAKKLNINI